MIHDINSDVSKCSACSEYYYVVLERTHAAAVQAQRPRVRRTRSQQLTRRAVVGLPREARAGSWVGVGGEAFIPQGNAGLETALGCRARRAAAPNCTPPRGHAFCLASPNACLKKMREPLGLSEHAASARAQRQRCSRPITSTPSTPPAAGLAFAPGHAGARLPPLLAHRLPRPPARRLHLPRSLRRASLQHSQGRGSCRWRGEGRRGNTARFGQVVRSDGRAIRRDSVPAVGR